MSNLPDIRGVLLAAGESRRIGFFPKPLLRMPHSAQTFVEHLTQSILQSVPQLTIVIGAQAARIRDIVDAHPEWSHSVTIVENPDYLRGQFSSLKTALCLIRSSANPLCDAVLVHLCDHPFVAGATFCALVTEYARIRPRILIARNFGRRGHPVVFDRRLFDELLDASEDQGARVVVNRDPSRVTYLDVDDPGVTLDLDTPTDLKAAGVDLPREASAAKSDK
jgi:molybdenum cofactor cytidylyltransferase